MWDVSLSVLSTFTFLHGYLDNLLEQSKHDDALISLE